MNLYIIIHTLLIESPKQGSVGTAEHPKDRSKIWHDSCPAIASSFEKAGLAHAQTLGPSSHFQAVAGQGVIVKLERATRSAVQRPASMSFTTMATTVMASAVPAPLLAIRAMLAAAMTRQVMAVVV